MVVEEFLYADGRVGEGVAVGREDLRRGQAADALQGVEIVAEGVGDRRVVRVLVQADVRGDPGQQVIAREQASVARESGRVRLLQVEADVARGVARRPDGAQAAAGEVEEFAGDDLAVGQRRREIGQDADGGPGQGRHMVVGCAGRRQLRRHVGEPAIGAVVARPPYEGDVGLVHRDPRPGHLADLARQAVVVRVVVGDHHAVDLAGRRAARQQALGERFPGQRVVPACVDEHRSAVGVDDVHQCVSEGIVRDGDPEGPYAPAVIGHLRRHLCHGLPCGRLPAQL